MIRLDPDVIPFFGCQPLTPDSEAPPPGVPCSNCGAVYDERGEVQTIPTTPEVAEATGVVAIRTGIHDGDDGLVCGRCGCLSPANRAKVASGTEPRRRRATKADVLAGRARLTRAERSGIKADAPAKTRPVVEAFLLREDAIEKGDAALAAALAGLLATAETARPKAFRRRLDQIRKGGRDATEAVNRPD